MILAFDSKIVFLQIYYSIHFYINAVKDLQFNLTLLKSILQIQFILHQLYPSHKNKQSLYK